MARVEWTNYRFMQPRVEKPGCSDGLEKFVVPCPLPGDLIPITLGIYIAIAYSNVSSDFVSELPFAQSFRDQS